MVDEQPQMYGAEALRGIKAAHERWVSESLRASGVRQTRPVWRRKTVPQYLVRFTTGTELLGLVLGSHAFAFDHDELRSEEETELVGGFLQEVHDYGDVGEDLEPRQRVSVSTELTKSLEELERAGFYVFGGREVRTLENGVRSPADFAIAILHVRRSTNDSIIRVSFPDQAEQPG